MNRTVVAKYTPGLGWESHGRLPDDVREYAQQIASAGEGAGVVPHHETSGRSEPQHKKSHAQIKREVDEILRSGPHRGSRDHATKITPRSFYEPGSSIMSHATRRDARVVRNGQGNFLDPPEYPSHEYHVQTDLRRHPENRGSMSLTHAVEEAPWLDPDTKRKAKELLDKWKTSRPALNSQKVQDWIHQVLGYFKNSYRNPSAGSQQWNVSKLIFDERDPVHNADDHAGVHLIRKFYPDFSPTEQDFAGAYWGKR